MGNGKNHSKKQTRRIEKRSDKTNKSNCFTDYRQREKKKKSAKNQKGKDHLTDFATLAEIWKEVSNSFSLTVFDFVTFAQKLIFFSLIPKSFQLGYFCL